MIAVLSTGKTVRLDMTLEEFWRETAYGAWIRAETTETHPEDRNGVRVNPTQIVYIRELP